MKTYHSIIASVLLLLLLLATSAPAAPTITSPNFTVTWTWSDPNYKGTLTGYHLKYGTTPGGPYGTTVNVLGATTLTNAFTNFALGTFYLVVTAYDANSESPQSGELAFTVVSPLKIAPGTPTITSTGLINISTRARVEQGDNAAIAGFILGGSERVAVRAIGPSLGAFGLDALDETTLELHDANGALLETNNGWKTGEDAQALIDAQLAPQSDKESALIASLAEGSYTAIMRGGAKDGIGLVEVYQLSPSGP